MATLALSIPRPQAEPNRALITVSVMLSTIMQVLDSTIANVALPHMQASLGAAPDTITWVLTSYIVASAIALPATGWLGDRIGRKQLLLVSIAGFVATSMLCGVAQDLTQMVLFRVAQGAFGAFLVPLGQATMLDAYPKHRHGYAMALWTMGVMVAPIMGPVLGGWLTDNFDWRWVFYVNLPIGLLAFAGTWLSVPATPTGDRRFDLAGFALIALAVASIQLMLDRGEQNDWFSSAETLIELGLAVSCAWMFVVHTVTTPQPLFPLVLFRDRNFAMGIGFIFVTGIMLFSSMALVPPMLQRLYGYPIITAGLLTAPRGLGMLVIMRLIGNYVSKVDPRWMILAGLAAIAYSMHQMTGLSLEADERLIIVSGVVQGVGFGLVNVPLNALAFATIAPQHRTDASSLFNLMRNLGSSIGISIVTVVLARNLQISHADIVTHMDPAVTAAVGSGAVQSLGGDTGGMILGMINNEITRQAGMVAYVDDFLLLMWGTLASMPLVLFMRRPKRQPVPEELHLAVE